MNDLLFGQYKCIVFDMDGTLAQSKSQITSSMGAVLERLLEKTYVAVISGGAWKQFETQLTPFIHPSRYKNLLILPASGTVLYRYRNNKWDPVYREVISPSERKKIIEKLQDAVLNAGYANDELWGIRIEDRESQVTYSGLGSTSPYEKKRFWDPDQKKRKQIISLLGDLSKRYSITIGGTSSIDITMKGVDKAYGIEKIKEVLGISSKDILFVGDKLKEGGNDFAVIRTGVAIKEVRDEHDTEAWLIEQLT